MIKHCLEDLMQQSDLSEQQAFDAVNDILNNANPAQIAAFFSVTAQQR